MKSWERTYLIKNMRGIIVPWKRGERALRVIKWLKKKYRFRILGFDISLIEQWKEVSEFFQNKPFTPLKPQISEDFFQQLIKDFEGILKKDFISGLILANNFASPMILVGGEKNWIDLKGFLTVGLIKDQISQKDLKFHLRVTDYAITDCYLWSINQIDKLLNFDFTEKNLNNIINKRKEFTIKDIKERYHRVLGGEKETEYAVTYFDFFTFLTDFREIFNNYILNWKDDFIKICSLIPIFYIGDK